MTSIPAMRAAVIDGFGPPEVLRVAQVPVPTPGPGQVLIRVSAAGVNAIDAFTRAGRGVGVPGFPAVLGWDVAGTVVVVGPDVTGLRVGDEVFGMARFPALAGAYAEFAAIPEDELVVIPAGVDHVTAAAAPMAGTTAWQSLFRHGGLAAGQRVLVHGAAGGVGHLAVQMACATGAEVVGTASARNHDFVMGLGAKQVVDYTDERVEDVVDGFDLVVDSRGGEDFARLLRVLKPGGTIVTLKGGAPEHAGLVAERGVRAGYTYVSPDVEAMAAVAAMLADGALRVAVGQPVPLADVVAAHRVVDEGHVRGRLVLDLA